MKGENALIYITIGLLFIYIAIAVIDFYELHKLKKRIDGLEAKRKYFDFVKALSVKAKKKGSSKKN